MSNYHILDGRMDGNRFRVIFHIPVPDEDNDALVNLRVALVQLLDSTVSSVPFITGAEQTQLDNGELYEYTWQYDTHPGLTLTQKRDALDTKFAEFSTSVVSQIRARLKYWGYGRDVP
jgi:hypothetical protein